MNSLGQRLKIIDLSGLEISGHDHPGFDLSGRNLTEYAVNVVHGEHVVHVVHGVHVEHILFEEFQHYSIFNKLTFSPSTSSEGDGEIVEFRVLRPFDLIELL